MLQDKYVTVDGLRTRYLEAGEGKPVVLVHGAALGTSADCWKANMEALSGRGLRLLAPDLPGYGHTDMPSDHSVRFRRHFILNFMDVLDIPRAALAGHSLGGQIVAQLAFAQPERVERIMVLATGSLLPPLPGGVVSGGPDSRPMQEPTLEETRAELESTTADHSKLTDDLVGGRRQMSLGRNFEASLARMSAPADPPVDPPIWARLDELPVPARFLYGNQDRGSAGQRAQIMREKYPTLDLHTFDDCKHNLMWDKSTEFESLAAEFLLAT